MTATSYQRGHLIHYDDKGDKWVYADTNECIEIERPCIRCGRMPTTEGYDACLGYIPGATSACCGHGVCSKILVRE
jgi:hypothetical protein